MDLLFLTVASFNVTFAPLGRFGSCNGQAQGLNEMVLEIGDSVHRSTSWFPHPSRGKRRKGLRGRSAFVSLEDSFPAS